MINSFKHAFRGLYFAFQERTVKVLLLIALLVIFLMIYLGLSLTEQAIILLTITLVLGLEFINSQVERTLNIVKPEFSKEVGEIKDISAGAVLIASIGSVIIGIIVFMPYIISIFN